ncbi:MAG TPA: 30S ribosomal protein S17 [Candidatus Thermoplasmatota archaeon]|nr:30S ribosomal protein S17 [Candidatus Thermoplasmatota archaeon]
MPIRDIGIDVQAPKRDPAPGDRMNPFNGTLTVRGSVIVGTVVSAKMQGTAIVEKQHQRVVEKYERIEKRTRRYAAHVPSNLDVKAGDEVVIAECRPLSKTVNFVVVENRGNPQELKAHHTDTVDSGKAAAATSKAAAKPAEKKPVTKTAAGTKKAAAESGRNA